MGKAGTNPDKKAVMWRTLCHRVYRIRNRRKRGTALDDDSSVVEENIVVMEF